MKHFTKGLCALTALLAVAGGALAQSDADVPDRTDGDGPYDRLVLRGGYLIDGSGAPTQGPVDIVIENDRIAEVRVVGAPKLDIDAERRPAAGTREIDVSGKYILPGFVNLHSHIHTLQDGQGTPPDYIFKLHLAHGITTIREVANSKPTAWLADLRERSERDEIAAPRIYPFTAFSPSESNPLNTPEQAREFIRDIKRDGGVGVKFFGAPEEILWAALDEAGKQGLRTTMHHAQLAVTHANVLDTSGHGLNSMEHWYGLPEAMFDDQVIQNYSPDYIYQDEQNRFGEAGKLWMQAADPYSERWEEVMETLLERDFGIIPTFTIYSASRDWMRSRNADWHDDYTLPSLWDFFRPDRHAHGSYWFDWGTEEEVAWRENFDLWMTFINEYKNRGGKVGVGKGLNVKGKSAKKNRLSGFVPFVQIHKEKHKSGVEFSPEWARVHVYYKSSEGRQEAADAMEALRKHWPSYSRKGLFRIDFLDSYDTCFGLEVPEFLLMDAYATGSIH